MTHTPHPSKNPPEGEAPEAQEHGKPTVVSRLSYFIREQLLKAGKEDEAAKYPAEAIPRLTMGNKEDELEKQRWLKKKHGIKAEPQPTGPYVPKNATAPSREAAPQPVSSSEPPQEFAAPAQSSDATGSIELTERRDGRVFYLTAPTDGYFEADIFLPNEKKARATQKLPLTAGNEHKIVLGPLLMFGAVRIEVKFTPDDGSGMLQKTITVEPEPDNI